MLFYEIPALFNKAFILGFRPLNLIYKSIGSSVPPLDKILFLNFEAILLLKIPFSLKYSKASASNTSAHL